MVRDYDFYTKEQLVSSPKIPLDVYTDDTQLFTAIAQVMIDLIRDHNVKNEKTVFIVPVGPVKQYPIFVKMVNEQKISLKNVWFFNMDEYITDDGEWIDIDHPLSFRGFMRDTVYTKIDPDLVMPEEQRVFPDPHDPGRGDRILADLGGADMCVGGIGINGHVAFNEPDPHLTNEIFLGQTTRVRPVSQATIVTAAIGDYHGALEEIPRYCITIGMKQIAAAKTICLGCFRDWHRGVVRRAAYGEPTAAFPVTLLQSHPDIRIKITDYVASLD